MNKKSFVQKVFHKVYSEKIYVKLILFLIPSFLTFFVFMIVYGLTRALEEIFLFLIPSVIFGIILNILFFVKAASEIYDEQLSAIRKYKQKTTSLKLDFNVNNILFSRFVSKGNKKTGNIGIAFYSIKIVNISNEPCTVKDVVLRYEFGDKKYSVISNVLITGIISPSKAKLDVNAIIVEMGTDKIIIGNWENLRTKLGLFKILEPGGVLEGSVFYVLEFDDIEKARILENVEIVISDYSGIESIHPIDIQEKWIVQGKNASIYPRSFISDGEGIIKND